MLRVRSRHRLFTMSGCARKPLSHLTQDGWKAPRAGQETGKLHAASTPLCEGRRISAGVETFKVRPGRFISGEGGLWKTRMVR
jgi:hypothetical protein